MQGFIQEFLVEEGKGGARGKFLPIFRCIILHVLECGLVCMRVILELYVMYFVIAILFFFFKGNRPTGIRTKKSYLKTTRSCMDTPMNMYSSKGHIKRLTGAFFLADIQTMT